MEYKGYAAKVEFDDSVGRLHGRVVNSGSYPIATFEATDVEGIRREFHRSIDEYLASCEEDGIEPRKPFSGKLNLRLGPDLHQRVAQFAAESGLSMNSWILQALEKSVSREIENSLMRFWLQLRARRATRGNRVSSGADNPPFRSPPLTPAEMISNWRRAPATSSRRG